MIQPDKPSEPDYQDTGDCAARIRDRLPRRLQEFREADSLSMDAMGRKCGVSRVLRKVRGVLEALLHMLHTLCISIVGF